MSVETKSPDVKSQISKIALDLGIEGGVATALAEKCYDEVYWRPYGGATSFVEIDSKKQADKYNYAVEDTTYQLRAIIENITSSDELGTADAKAAAIAQAASDFRSRVNSLSLEEDSKSLWDKVKSLILHEEKVIKKEGGKWVLYSKDGKKKLGTHETRADAVAQERAIEANKIKETQTATKGGFKVFKDKDGNLRWLSYSSNAFEDTDKELFTTEALEEAVEYADKTKERGPLLVYHVPTTEIGHCDFQAVEGRFLIESGTFDDTPLGLKAAEYFASSDKERQVSIGFEYYDGDELDGVYDWLRIKERSVCPYGAAANPWTLFQTIGGKELNDKKKEDLIDIFGPELAGAAIAQASDATKELEGKGIKFKETKKEDDDEEDEDKKYPNKKELLELHATIKSLPESVLRTTLETQLVALNGGKAIEEETPVETTTPAAEAVLGTAQVEKLGTVLAELITKVDELGSVKEAVTQLQSQVKELQASEDEKIANAWSPKLARITGDGIVRPTESKDNVVQTAKEFVEGLNPDADANPALAYVKDLFGQSAVSA